MNKVRLLGVVLGLGLSLQALAFGSKEDLFKATCKADRIALQDSQMETKEFRFMCRLVGFFIRIVNNIPQKNDFRK